MLREPLRVCERKLEQHIFNKWHHDMTHLWQNWLEENTRDISLVFRYEKFEVLRIWLYQYPVYWSFWNSTHQWCVFKSVTSFLIVSVWRINKEVWLNILPRIRKFSFLPKLFNVTSQRPSCFFQWIALYFTQIRIRHIIQSYVPPSQK